jgi:hypothetical protein
MGIKDLSPWSFGPTGHHPDGLNLKNFTPEEQCLLYEIGMASNRSLLGLVVGSHTCVVHDVGSSHAAAACSHLSRLLSSHGPHGYVLSPYVADEYLLWKHMQHIQWVVLATGRTVGPYKNPTTKAVTSGHVGRLHSLLCMTVVDGVIVLKGLSLKGTAKPPHGKLVEVPSDMVVRRQRAGQGGAGLRRGEGQRSEGQSSAVAWSPLTHEEHHVASECLRLRMAKGWRLLMEGSGGGCDELKSDAHLAALAGGLTVDRPIVQPQATGGVTTATMPSSLKLFAARAKSELDAPGGLVDIWPHAVAMQSDTACDYVALTRARCLFTSSLPCVQGLQVNQPALANGLLPRLAGCLQPPPTKLPSDLHHDLHHQRWTAWSLERAPWAGRSMSALPSSTQLIEDNAWWERNRPSSDVRRLANKEDEDEDEYE